MTAPVAACPHHWDIEPVGPGHVSKARCLLCGAEKTMANYLESGINARGRLVWKAPEVDQETPGKGDSMAKGLNPHQRSAELKSLKERAIELAREGKTVAEIRALPEFRDMSYSTLYGWLPARPNPQKAVRNKAETPAPADPPWQPAAPVSAATPALPLRRHPASNSSEQRLPSLLQDLVDMLPLAATQAKKSQWLDAFIAIYSLLYLEVEKGD